MEKLIRPSCKALVIKNGRLLTLQKQNDNEIYFVLPGGGQIWGEGLLETLRRECIEEISVQPDSIGKLLFIRESYKPKDKISNGIYYHRIDYIFECDLDETKVKIGINPDEYQESITWLNIESLGSSNFQPNGLIPYIEDYYHGKYPVNTYLGIID